MPVTVGLRAGLRVALLFLLAIVAGSANGATPNAAQVARYGGAPVLRFVDADFARADSRTPPVSGWERAPVGRSHSFESMGRTSSTKTLWVRLTFDRSRLGDGAQALYAENNHERFVAYLNGREIFRTFTEGDTRALGWYRPYLAGLPDDALRAGMNTVLIRIESNYDLVSGNFRIGSAAALQPLYASRTFWRITGVQAANFSMLVAVVAAFVFWLSRRRDIELLVVSFLGVAWFARNYNFTATEAPFAVVPFKLMTYYTVYPAMAASLAFCLVFARVAHWQRHTVILAAMGVLLCLSRLLTVDTRLVADFGSDTIGNVLTMGCAAYTLALLLRHWWHNGSTTALWLTAALLGVIAGTAHDIGRLWDVRWWDGLGFYLQPYIGSIFCLVMLLAFGVRAYRAFAGIESINAVLETRIADARSELERSEAERRGLEVERALVGERERIMREMHDGIGSNLVAAITVAERKDHPPETVRILRRALFDLKLTVDSLEPFRGDIVALLGNFRHRAEPDLVAAGITSRWLVEPCARLDWLDAANALHVLRIFQEALANTLLHANASRITLSCAEGSWEDRAVVITSLTDDGRGFEQEALARHRGGLDNMRQRAAAIEASFACVSAPARGTTIMLALPIVRGVST